MSGMKTQTVKVNLGNVCQFESESSVFAHSQNMNLSHKSVKGESKTREKSERASLSLAESQLRTSLCKIFGKLLKGEDISPTSPILRYFCAFR